MRLDDSPRLTLRFLVWVYVALVVYASLYPFSGWQDPGEPWWAYLFKPPSPYWTGFDVVSNLVGYLPLGALVCVAHARSPEVNGRWVGLVLSVCALSLAMETTQNYLPWRVPSNVDLLLNSLGATCGGLIGLGLLRVGWVSRLQRWRRQWWLKEASAALALFMLWPFAQLYPLPVPYATGAFVSPLLAPLSAWVADSGLAPYWPSFEAVAAPSGLTPGGLWLLTVLALLAPCLLAYAVSPVGQRRLIVGLGMVGIGVASLTLSTALHVGPSHALAWLTPLTMSATVVAGTLALLLFWLHPRSAAALALMVLVMQLTLVNQMPTDGYWAQNLQAWEQGRFIRFHGLSQWLAWGWPLVALGLALRALLAPGGRGH